MNLVRSEVKKVAWSTSRSFFGGYLTDTIKDLDLYPQHVTPPDTAIHPLKYEEPLYGFLPRHKWRIPLLFTSYK